MLQIIGITSLHEDEHLINTIRDHNEGAFTTDSNIKTLQQYRFSAVKIAVDAESLQNA